MPEQATRRGFLARLVAGVGAMIGAGGIAKGATGGKAGCLVPMDAGGVVGGGYPTCSGRAL